MKTETEKRNYIQELTDLGFSLNILSGPRGEVDKHDQSDWPHIAYDVELKFGDKRVLITPYKLGVGHVNPNKEKQAFVGRSDAESIIYHWQKKSSCQFKDKKLHARVAATLAFNQNVKPKLEDVMHSLLLDGDPHFNNESFEDWCANYGYNEDSRRVEAMYRTCCETGRQIARAVPRETIEQAREILQDF